MILGASGLAAAAGRAAAAGPRAVRIGQGPIITPDTDPSIGTNIAEPSLIRVPSWARNRLGRYYLYFADHVGSFIRMAYADRLEGPWKVHGPGVLHIDKTPFPPGIEGAHIASPDVHVDHERRRFVMYFHGLERLPNTQVTRVATSTDGLDFTSGAEILGLTYWRAFPFRGQTYAMAMPGQFYRSSDPLTGFEKGPRLFNLNMRHGSVVVRGDQLKVVWTQVGDAPECIYLTTIDASGPWKTWKEVGPPIEILRPERRWEGADLPKVPSVRGAIETPVNQLRDPAFFEDQGRLFMVYAIAGERGLALAEVFL